ncbi:DNA utilization protein GntX [Pantoea ananatis]|uniref:DNA utilization protein GntX n=1 Tax=Pantoea ananas TaxID=553 RepID=UPI000CF3EF1B|nr:DNA utilization protein GntX [Pantoea ananatis]MCH9271678.1 DNA utilization protein GntX [Pantoea ananatis]PQK71945.1 DNA utilization protein GntX [Pantoea ananatis]PVY83339.1 ComF family protein [Pantoea ananatis]REE66810.1 ComF family protein [Pantoea ananatis]RQN05947.1 DNA utilization protein GntX [Pantoea ananatis]
MLPMPALCWLCQLPLRIALHGLCSICLRQLPRLPSLCPCCGLPAASDALPCGRCLLRPPPWQALISVSHYQPPLSTWVNQLKFSGITALRVMLARLLLLSWLNAYRRGQTVRPDLLMCVPLHARRCWRRGYNQTALLATPLARWLECEFSLALSRQRAGAVQHQLSARQRRRNLRGAFCLETDVNGRHIALIDDVVTTGSTVREISRLLQGRGAASVQVWCLCRTL